MTAPFRCPTPCDADCAALCHEWHVPAYKRDHDAEACEQRHRREDGSVGELQGGATLFEVGRSDRALCPACGYSVRMEEDQFTTHSLWPTRAVCAGSGERVRR